MSQIDVDTVWRMLDEIKDPEIPVVSIVELGIAREVELDGARVRVTLTPTFSGCPAVRVMKMQIEQQLQQAGLQPEVVFSYNPPYSTGWMTPSARQKLKAFGLAPPPLFTGSLESALETPSACPFCGSKDIVLQNSFGSTLCRSIYTCNTCRQPFEQFKPL